MFSTNICILLQLNETHKYLIQKISSNQFTSLWQSTIGYVLKYKIYFSFLNYKCIAVCKLIIRTRYDALTISVMSCKTKYVIIAEKQSYIRTGRLLKSKLGICSSFNKRLDCSDDPLVKIIICGGTTASPILPGMPMSKSEYKRRYNQIYVDTYVEAKTRRYQSRKKHHLYYNNKVISDTHD